MAPPLRSGVLREGKGREKYFPSPLSPEKAGMRRTSAEAISRGRGAEGATIAP